jgi:regulator of RNase E activity RraA
VVIQQPDDQKCAVLGGIHALNIVQRGAEAIVVAGRVRDRSELNKLNTQVWAHGTSTVGAGAEAKAYATQVRIKAGEMYIEPGDIIFCDPDEGVVAIPRDAVVEVLSYLSAHVKTEEKIKEDVSKGMSVTDAFAKWR